MTLRILPDDWPAMLARAFPNAPMERIHWVADALPGAVDAYELNTPLRLAHFLAQIGHESGELRWMEEIASGAAYERRRDLGNVKPGDGRRFKGRGPIMLTGRANYARYGEHAGVDLEADPERVVKDRALWLGSAGWYWCCGNPTGRSLNRHADADDIRTITRRINGGFNGLADRQRLTELAKGAIEWAESRTLQRWLNRLGGADLVEDGVIGALSREALALYQASRGMDATGRADAKTWAEMEREWQRLAEHEVRGGALADDDYAGGMIGVTEDASNAVLEGPGEVILRLAGGRESVIPIPQNMRARVTVETIDPGALVAGTTPAAA